MCILQHFYEGLLCIIQHFYEGLLCTIHILNRIKSAKKQADNVVLEIPTFVSRRTMNYSQWLSQTII